MLVQFINIYLIQSRQSQFKNDLKEFYLQKALSVEILNCESCGVIFMPLYF